MPKANSSSPEENSISPGPKYDPSDTYGARWRNYVNILLGRLGEGDMRRFQIQQEEDRWPSDCKSCESNKEFLWNYSPIIRFMRENIERLGGNLEPGHFNCRKCTSVLQPGHARPHNGGFDPDWGIELCANYFQRRADQEDVMAHEMIHVYDHLRFKVDWSNDIRHAACSEIRASSLSGECRFLKEFWTRGQMKLTRQHQECVKRRATLSILRRPNCKDEAAAAKAVDDVWDSCFADTRPFDEIYR